MVRDKLPGRSTSAAFALPCHRTTSHPLMRLRLMLFACCIGLPIAVVGQAVRDEFRVVRSSAELRAHTPATITVTGGPQETELTGDFRCRVIPAHADIGQRRLRENGCVVQFFVDPQRTRLTRFALDRKMGIDVIVYRGETRAGFLSTTLTYVP